MGLKIKVSKNITNTLVMAVMIFSAAALWTKSTKTLYIIITGLCFGYVLIKCASYANIKRVINSRFFVHFTCMLIIFGIDAYLRTQASEYNHDFQLFTWVSVVIMMLLMISCKDEEELISQICLSCKIAVVLICLYIVVTSGGNTAGEFDRIGNNLSGNVITVGMYLGTCVLAVLFRYLLWHKKSDLFVYIIVNVFMLLTGSKLVFFNMICAMIMYIKIGKPSKKLRRILLIIVAVFSLVLLIFTNDYLYNIIGARTIDFLYEMGWIKSATAQRSNSTIIRLSLIRTSFDAFMNSPIIGSGFGTVASKPPYYCYSHNNFLEMLACYGMMGFVLFYYMHVWVFRKAKKNVHNNSFKTFIGISILNILFYDITQITYSAGWLNYYSLIVGASFIIVACKTKEKNTHEY